MAFSTGSFAELPFSTVGGTSYFPTVSETATGSDTVSSAASFSSSTSDTATASDSIASALSAVSNVSETATASDAVS